MVAKQPASAPFHFPLLRAFVSPHPPPPHQLFPAFLRGSEIREQSLNVSQLRGPQKRNGSRSSGLAGKTLAGPFPFFLPSVVPSILPFLPSFLSLSSILPPSIPPSLLPPITPNTYHLSGSLEELIVGRRHKPLALMGSPRSLSADPVCSSSIRQRWCSGTSSQGPLAASIDPYMWVMAIGFPEDVTGASEEEVGSHLSNIPSPSLFLWRPSLPESSLSLWSSSDSLSPSSGSCSHPPCLPHHPSPTSLSPYWFLHCVVYCPASLCLRRCKKFHALLPTLILPPPIRKQSSSYLGPTWGCVCLGVSMYKIALQYHLGID